MNRKILCCGDPNNTQEDELGNKKNVTLPVGTDKVFDFTKAPNEKEEGGYLVGFYGQYDGDYITYLGAYVATYSQIHYYCRRPYILLYSHLKESAQSTKQIEKLLNLKRLQNGKIDGARIDDKSPKILFYLMDSSLRYRDLFKSVLDYLY